MLSEERGVKGSNKEMAPMLEGAMPLLLGARERAEIRKRALLVYLILNAYWEPLKFELPLIEDGSRRQWQRWIDTSLDSPQDIVGWQSASPVSAGTYSAGPRSVAVLFASTK